MILVKAEQRVVVAGNANVYGVKCEQMDRQRPVRSMLDLRHTAALAGTGKSVDDRYKIYELLMEDMSIVVIYPFALNSAILALLEQCRYVHTDNAEYPGAGPGPCPSRQNKACRMPNTWLIHYFSATWMPERATVYCVVVHREVFRTRSAVGAKPASQPCPCCCALPQHVGSRVCLVFPKVLLLFCLFIYYL